MTPSIKHRFVSTKPEQLDQTLVGPREWNDEHVLVNFAESVKSIVSDLRGVNNVDFLFSVPLAQSLVAGVVNTLVFTPVPAGINGFDFCHFILINDGLATEAVLITGGNAVSGAPSGTVLFTPVFNHAPGGGASIQSATAGIAEGAVSVKNTGGIVNISNGTFTIYASIPIYSRISYRGQGASATTLVPANGNVTVFNACMEHPRPPNHQRAPRAPNLVSFEDFMIDASSFVGINNVFGMRFSNFPTDQNIISYESILFKDIIFNNTYYAIYMDLGAYITMIRCMTTCNSQVYFGDTATTLIRPSYGITVSHHIYTWSMIKPGDPNMYTPDPGIANFQFHNCQVVNFNNCIFDGGGSTKGKAIYLHGQCIAINISNCLFDDWGWAVYCDAVMIANVKYCSDGCKFDNNTIIQYGAQTGIDTYLAGVLLFIDGDTTGHHKNWMISNNTFTVTDCMFNIGAYAEDFVIANNFFLSRDTPNHHSVIIREHTRNLLFNRNYWKAEAYAFGAIYNYTTDYPLFGLEDDLFIGWAPHRILEVDGLNPPDFVTSVSRTKIVLLQGDNILLTTTHAPVPGCTITIDKDGMYLIVAGFEFYGSGAGDLNFAFGGSLTVDGTQQLQKCWFDIALANFGGTTNQQYVLNLRRGQIITSVAWKTGGTGNSALYQTGTNLSATLCGNFNE